MLVIDVPGYKELTLKHLVLDYNGTLAVDGMLLERAGEKLNALAKNLEVHVITADTFGKAKEQLGGVNCQLHIAPKDNQDQIKLDYINSLGADNVVAVGNGRNDRLMLQAAILGIVVLQREGVSAQSLLSADVVCQNIDDALDLLANPLRLVATLRS